MNDPLDDYTRQLAGQKELIHAQGDESVKNYLPTLHSQMQEAQAVVIEQINPKKVVRDILLELDGKEIDESSGDVIQVSDPYVNEEGLRELKIKIKTFVHQATTMSFLDEKVIKNIMMSFEESLITDLGLNWRQWGIKSRAICDTIADLILFTAFLTLKRAEEQNEKRFLKGISFESIGGAGSQAAKKKEGGWDKFISKIRL